MLSNEDRILPYAADCTEQTRPYMYSKSVKIFVLKSAYNLVCVIMNSYVFLYPGET